MTRREIRRELTEDEKLFLKELGELEGLETASENMMAERLGWDADRVFFTAMSLRKIGLVTVRYVETYELK